MFLSLGITNFVLSQNLRSVIDINLLIVLIDWYEGGDVQCNKKVGISCWIKNTVFTSLWETNPHIIMPNKPKKHNKILLHLKTDVQKDRSKGSGKPTLKI